jgi:hypothetical protein
MTASGGNTIAMMGTLDLRQGPAVLSGFSNTRMSNSFSSKHSGADAAEYVAVELTHQECFQRTPQTTGSQVGLVIGAQRHVGRIPAREDFVRTAACADATFDAQTLIDDFELKKMGWFNGRDALCQIPSPVRAADRRTNGTFVAFGADRMWQQRAKK